jgi:hypothetical protein
VGRGRAQRPRSVAGWGSRRRKGYVGRGGGRRRLSAAGFFPIFSISCSCFLFFYFMLFSFELKFKHKFADYVNALPE